MSDQLPAIPDPQVPATGHTNGIEPWVQTQPLDPMMAEESEGISWRRFAAAIARQKWLIGLTFLVGSAVSAAIWMMIEPEYEAEVTLWIEQGQDPQTGPIQSANLLQNYAWVDLLRSLPVLEPVVRQEKLFLNAVNPADSLALVGFEVGENPVPGLYRLSVDADGERYSLTRDRHGLVEEGTVGDSIGRSLGFRWQPRESVLSPDRVIDFNVVSPFEAARRLASDLVPNMVPPGTFLRLRLRGGDPGRAARVLNAVAEMHVETAARLKRRDADDLVAVLEEQKDDVYQDLRNSEIELEQFRVQTITLPSDRTIPVAPGIQATTNPVLNDFFSKQLRLDAVQQDAERIERVLARPGALDIETLELVPAAQNSRQLMSALADLTTRETELRTLLYRYTDADPRVVEKRAEIARLGTETIPAITQGVLASLRREELQLSEDIEAASTQLRQIPTRTIEEQRLQRSVAAADGLFTEISSRLEMARLAAASTVPDVRIWARASVPQFPIPDQRLRLVLMVLGGSLGLALMGALLLDRIDPRVQYPEQVTSGMGLTILGAVPPIKRLQGKRGEENTEHVVEAFRELRLNLLYAYGSAGPGPLLITVSSPGSGDGKSLITANLGVAFAELGRKTLIIDADTRRGDVHQLLGRRRKPGLTDFLAGDATRSEIVQATEYDSLHLVASGSRLTHAPELIGSVEMRELFADLRTEYGIILVDSPPLGAGSDAFMLGTLTGNLVMVLRTGTTNRELTLARLAPLGRLPIRILGAILNDVQPDGIYRYYSSYLPGYGTADEEPVDRRPALQGAD